ncbi:MAG: catechol-2,3-dioxygenase [Polaribacter sp.]
MELIGRNRLNNPSDEVFNVNSLLEISEIGLVTSDIEPIFQQLQKKCGLPQYSGSMDSFCTIGGEHGLFICINGDKRNWYPRGDKAFPSAFQVDILVEQKSYIVNYQNYKLDISPENAD